MTPPVVVAPFVGAGPVPLKVSLSEPVAVGKVTPRETLSPALTTVPSPAPVAVPSAPIAEATSVPAEMVVRPV